MHTFWNTQPVPDTHMGRIGEIDTSHTFDTEPVALPDEYVWSECSVPEIANLLSTHYVRDEHFALRYDAAFIEWATIPEWNLGLRTKHGGKLVGFISGVPCKYRIHDTIVDTLQINFLCVHDTLRSKGFAPLLISEIRRRANAEGIWQAVYTAVTHIPTPVARTSYWHRLLNVPKLNSAKFSNERQRPHMVRGTSTYTYMTEEDIPVVTEMLQKHLKEYSIAPHIDDAYVRRWLVPKDGIVYSYIDGDKGFTSYYAVPYTSVKTGIEVKQAYMFYDTSDGDMRDAVILARNTGFDVYNTLDVGLSMSTLRDSKFMKGNGHNHCYVYNWSCGDILPNEIFMRFF